MHLILFDVDGTLIDSQAIILESQRRTLADLVLAHPGREAGLAIVGLSLPQAFRQLLGVDVDLQPVIAHYGEVFGQLRASGEWDSPLFPGAGATIDALAARGDVALGLATGKSQRGVRHLLDHYGWHEHFVTLQTADTNPSKPHPGMVLTAMAEAGAAPGETIVIGDTSFDMAMARAAGAGALGVSWGYHHPEALRAAGAQHIADAFEDVIAWIDGHVG